MQQKTTADSRGARSLNQTNPYDITRPLGPYACAGLLHHLSWFVDNLMQLMSSPGRWFHPSRMQATRCRISWPGILWSFRASGLAFCDLTDRRKKRYSVAGYVPKYLGGNIFYLIPWITMHIMVSLPPMLTCCKILRSSTAARPGPLCLPFSWLDKTLLLLQHRH